MIQKFNITMLNVIIHILGAMGKLKEKDAIGKGANASVNSKLTRKFVLKFWLHISYQIFLFQFPLLQVLFLFDLNIAQSEYW